MSDKKISPELEEQIREIVRDEIAKKKRIDVENFRKALSVNQDGSITANLSTIKTQNS